MKSQNCWNTICDFNQGTPFWLASKRESWAFPHKKQKMHITKRNINSYCIHIRCTPVELFTQLFHLLLLYYVIHISLFIISCAGRQIYIYSTLSWYLTVTVAHWPQLPQSQSQHIVLTRHSVRVVATLCHYNSVHLYSQGTGKCY